MTKQQLKLIAHKTADRLIAELLIGADWCPKWNNEYPQPTTIAQAAEWLLNDMECDGHSAIVCSERYPQDINDTTKINNYVQYHLKALVTVGGIK